MTFSSRPEIIISSTAMAEPAMTFQLMVIYEASTKLPVPPKEREEKEKNFRKALINPLWVMASTTKVTRGTHRTNHRGTLGRKNTSPAKTSAQPRVNNPAGRYLTPTMPMPR